LVSRKDYSGGVRIDDTNGIAGVEVEISLSHSIAITENGNAGRTVSILSWMFTAKYYQIINLK